jgi:hypothetical protein
MEHAFAQIKQLVEDFKNNEKFYLSDKYQESHARQDFIDKFFAALGWDVTHERQKNPYEQEVKIENKVSTQGSQRRADYAFFIAPNFRDVKFYAEAKKPAKNLKDAAFYHQTIRYGWNSGTPIAILTDFEEFHILDCRYKPDLDDALNRKLEYFHYSEYADEEKFKKIFYLFSREAVANGSLEKYAAALPKPRGKAIQRGLFKGGYQPVDEAFLEELDSYRETLAKAFKKENPDLGSEELTEAVQRTIDRLVFIRFLEDKQIEDPQMINYSEASSTWKKFSAHCRALEPKYNGLVFKKHRILDGSGFVPPDDNTFADICNELADPSSPYDFDKIPISILGSIYERFLGKVVHATAKQVKVELKPEVRKAGGVYYTPQYIVRYIVKETVGKLLYATPTVSTKNVEPTPPYQGGEIQGKISSPQRGEVSRRDRGVDNFDSLQGKTPEEISKMSFADIACGSGSFLIEVYSVLLEYHERYYAAHPEAAKKGDLSTRDGKQVLSLKKRQEILVNNIYGVDIDFQATEVTQLSLYLKLLEEATLNDAVQFSLLKEKLLPDLRNNIICGNSLIGTDIFDGELFAQNISSPSQGEVSRRDEGVEKLKPMNFEDAFPSVMKRGGFDAIVGNPPYIQSRSEQFSEIEKEYYIKNYSTVEYQINTFGLFIENSLQNIKLNGILGYIIPNYWLSTRYDKKLRDYLFIENHTKEIVNTYNIFSEATVDTLIIITQRTNSKVFPKTILLRSVDRNYKTILERLLAIEQLNWAFEKEEVVESNKSNTVISFANKIDIKGSKIISDYFILKFGMKPYEKGKGIPKQTREMMKNKIYDAKKKIDKSYHPLLRARNIHRYTVDWESDWIKYGDNLAAPRTFNLFTGPRILIQRILTSDTFFGVYTDQTFICNTDVITLKPKQTNDNSISILFFVGILLTKLTAKFVKNSNINLDREAFPKINTETLGTFPIPNIDLGNSLDKSRHDAIVKLVEQMLKAKEELAAAKLDQDVQRLEHRCATLDRQIDEAVYELYGLTPDEIAIVEGKN